MIHVTRARARSATKGRALKRTPPGSPPGSSRAPKRLDPRRPALGTLAAVRGLRQAARHPRLRRLAPGTLACLPGSLRRLAHLGPGGSLTRATERLRCAAANLRRTPWRLRELALGLAILPIGAAVSLAFAASAGLPTHAGAGSGTSGTLLRYHDTMLPLPRASIPPPPTGPPILQSLPPNPSITRLSAPTPGAGSSAPSAAYPPSSVQAIITAAAQADGVNPAWMISTAECESGLRTNAYNPSGPYYGIFQFLASTFRAHGGTNIWDPTQQAQIAASMFASGDSVAWPVCSLR